MINFSCFYINYLSYKNLKYEKIYYCFLKLFNIGYILLSASCNSVLFFAPKNYYIYFHKYLLKLEISFF